MVTVKSSGPVIVKTVVCSKCAYELEYTGEDVQSKSGYDDTMYHFIVCPRGSCKEKVYVPKWTTTNSG